MALPLQFAHLGSTGVIQNPGDLGSLGQAMQGLPQILQANQQLQMERERQAMNQQYQQAQMDHLRKIEAGQAAASAEEGRSNAAVGQAIQLLGTPQTGATMVNPSLAGMNPMVLPLQGPPPGVEDVIGAMNPRDVPAFLDKGKDAITASKAEAAQRMSLQKFDRAVAKLPPDHAEALKTIVALGNEAPADVRTSLYNTMTGVAAKKDSATALALFNGGAITTGQLFEMVGGKPPEGVDLNYKKPRTDQLSTILFRNQVERDMGVPGDFEQKALKNSRQLIPAMRNLESADFKPMSRADMFAVTTGLHSVDEFMKANLSGPHKAALQAIKVFMNPVLRDETGAAFGKMEPPEVFDRFIPFADDPPSVRATKAAARRELALSIAGAGGRAASDQIRRGTLTQEEWDAGLNFLQTPYRNQKHWVPK
jgi:hypothetical protein